MLLQDEEDDKKKTVWKSCCFIADKRAVKYISTLSIGLIIILFSMVQLSKKDVSKEKEVIYFSLFTSTIAAFLPAPSPH